MLQTNSPVPQPVPVWTTDQRHVLYDASTSSVVIRDLVVDDPLVVSESRFWAEGRRGDAAPPEVLADADLTAFVHQALGVGARAISSAGSVQQAYDLEALVIEVGDRSCRAAQDAADLTGAAATQASEAVQKASVVVRQSMTEAGDLARKAFGENVETVRRQLADEIDRLVGGEQPELLRRLQPVLDTFGRQLHTQSSEQTTLLIEKVVRQFDPADPVSPMSQQMRMLTEAQRKHAESVTEQHLELTAKVEELGRLLVTKRATEIALARTPAKGGAYEDQVHDLMRIIAAGLGDEYVNTGNVTGLVSRNKKGDGVLTVGDTDARVVLEMTDSPRTQWNTYLREAEQNRGAQASLGVARTAEQLSGNSVLTLGPRRIVVAFDPNRDDPQLLRGFIQVLRLAAQTAVSRLDSAEVTTADERIVEALKVLEKIAKIQKAAGLIRSSATSIDSDAGGLHSDLTRLLTQARTSLAAASHEVHHDAA